MAESYSVKAILSAQDRGFSSTLKSCSNTLDKIDSKISGFSFGVLTGAGQAAFNALTNGASEMIGEVNDASKSWQTFEGNMKNFGKSEKYIADVRNELQSFAEDTVYSSSDMASTFAQLEAVGVGGMKSLTKGTTGLVKGFGGLAAAAENPQQAMKSLSQQATQMAAKPKVAWEDFKIMLEQSPAGMAAIAKEMGMSTSDLIAKIQAGEVKTESFFAAIEKAGNSKGFQEQATQAKTIDQAMDGVKETIGNKLLPAFNEVSKLGIGALDGIAGKIGEIDGEELATKVMAGIEKAKPYYESFKETCVEVGGVIKQVGGFLSEHSDTISKAVPWIVKAALAYKGFKVVSTVVGPVASFTKNIASLAGKGIGGIASKLFGISTAQKTVGTASATSGTQMLMAAKSYALMGVAVLAIAAGFALLAFSAIQLANAGGLAIGVMAGLVVGVAAIGVGMAFLLKMLAPMGAQMMPVATAMLAMGAAVLLVSAGFAVLALTSIQLANAGGLAIGIMVGMVATIALLAVGAAALGPALTAGAVGFIAFGAAIVMVGAGAVLAAAALAIVSAVLPAIIANGTQGAAAIITLSGAMVAFAGGAALAGAAAIVLGAGLTVAALGITAAGVAALVAAVGITALAAGCTLLGASIMVTAAGIALLGATLPLATAGATAATASFALLLAGTVGLTAALTLLNVPLLLVAASSLTASVGVLAFGVAMTTGAAGTLLMLGALSGVGSQMKTISKSAKSAEKSLDSMRDSIDIVESGLDGLGSKAKSALKSIKSAFDDTASEAKSAGQKVGDNFAKSMQSGLKQAATNTLSTATAMNTVFNSAAKNAKMSGTNLGNGFAMGMMGGMNSARAVASSTTSTVNATLRSGRSGAYSAGAYVSAGFAAGMRSELSAIRSAANAMVAAANKAIEAKAKIASPSKVTDKLGGYYGEGWVNGILSKVKSAWNAATELVSIPQVATPQLAGAYGFELSSDYDYIRNPEYIIEVPLTVDGKEFARATASYTQAELNRNQTRENRKRGKV